MSPKTKPDSTTRQDQTFLYKHKQKLIGLFFWIGLIAFYQWFAMTNNLNTVEVIQLLLDFLTQGLRGPLLYVLLYAIRPLIFFPASLLTIASGFVFGPILGVVYTVIASNVSASIAYSVARFFGKGILKEDNPEGLLLRYTHRLRENSFETVMFMRFIFLPYDAVSYFAGFLRINFWPFILATALGSIPGTIAFVGFGASIERFTGAIPTFNPVTLGYSLIILVLSILLSRFLKKREGIKNDK